ncbi:membrane protein [Betaproteobacteria bacterium]|nr:membrane protein [Betaproteobacteria bacterium]
MGKQIVRQPSQSKKQEQPRILAAQQRWQGPLPPLESLASFNEIIPNGAERIMAMAEQEQAHRFESEKKYMNALVQDTRRGHWMGLAIGLSSIAASVYTAIIGALVSQYCACRRPNPRDY